jgi:hypothetical protein
MSDPRFIAVADKRHFPAVVDPRVKYEPLKYKVAYVPTVFKPER